MESPSRRRGFLKFLVVGGLVAWTGADATAGEPDPATYWDVKDIRPGMKGKGQTVMVGMKLEEFEAEVLGVMRDVNPGRDMVLCRLKGCNLEHAGIIQGMSGSPIYIDGKLLGAVAYAWEFAKDPIAGVTPFSQMVQYVRSNDRRIAAESKARAKDGGFRGGGLVSRPGSRDSPARSPAWEHPCGRSRSRAERWAAMTPIVTPLAASGFSPRALSAAGRPAPADRHGADGRRLGARADRPRGGRSPAGPGGSAQHRAGAR